jgi:ribonuclease Z
VSDLRLLFWNIVFFILFLQTYAFRHEAKIFNQTGGIKMTVTKVLHRETFEGISILAVLWIFCFALAVPTMVLSADDFTVTLLGTGMPVPAPDRFGNSTLVEAGGQRLVFDMGRGATIRLWQKQIPLGSIDAHFLTHLHSDHINGLSDLWLSGWIQTPFGGRKKPFLIYGPPGTEKMMANLWEAFSEDRRIRLADEKNPLTGIQVDAHDFKPGVVYEKNGVVVTTFEVDHGDLVKPCYGFKITYKNHSVVISGDTRYSTNLEKAASGADLLVCEVAMIPEKLFDKYPVYKAIYEHHISPEQAGKLFTASRPKMAVYTHLVLSGLPKEGIPFPTPEDLLAATRKTYDGRVMVGADLMGFTIDDTGVSIIQPPR